MMISHSDDDMHCCLFNCSWYLCLTLCYRFIYYIIYYSTVNIVLTILKASVLF